MTPARQYPGHTLRKKCGYGNRIIQLKDGGLSDNATAGAQVGAAQPA